MNRSLSHGKPMEESCESSHRDKGRFFIKKISYEELFKMQDYWYKRTIDFDCGTHNVGSVEIDEHENPQLIDYLKKGFKELAEKYFKMF